MPDNRQKLIHLHSSSVKVPTAAQLEYGEIAIQYDATAPVLYIKNSSNQIVKFIDEAAVKALLTNVYTYKGSKATYEELPESGNVTGDVWNVVAAHGNIPAGTNYAWDGTQWDSLGGSVDLSTYITNDTFTAHTSNTDVHVTTTQTAAWNAKQNALANADVLTGITSQKVSDWDSAATASHTHANQSVLDGIASTDVDAWNGAVNTLNTHTADTTIHVTSAQTDSWDAKQNAISDLETIRNNASSGKNAYDTVEANKDNWDAAYTVSQNALVGIETGKESGAAVSQNKKLDFSGLVINCGEY